MTFSPDVVSAPGSASIRHRRRWRLSRAGIVNVWHYLDTEFTMSGGRMILRGTNGSGKSRALEMLLPFLLDADRKRMDATGAGKVDLDELMQTGAAGQINRVGYLWIELSRPDGILTVGAHIRYSATAHRSEVYFFTTGLQVGTDLHLVDDNRIPLSRDDLATRIGADRLTREPEQHRDTVRELVFGLRGEAGRERYAGLLQLLHTLRSPDVGNRIDEGRLPQILSEALPPLAENMLVAAGGQLDLLGEARQDQVRAESTQAIVRRFHTVYRRYAADLLRTDAEAAVAAADRVTATRDELDAAESDAADLDAQAAAADTRLRERREQVVELERAIRGLETHELFRAADDLAQRQKVVDTLGQAADHAVESASRARRRERLDAEHAAELLDELSAAVTRAAERMGAAERELSAAGIAHGALPLDLRLDVDRPVAGLEPVRVGRHEAPEAVSRPVVADAQVVPEHVEDVGIAAEQAAVAARRRRDQAGRRLVEARRLELAAHAVRDAETTAEHAAGEAERLDSEVGEADAGVRDAALTLRHRWREWLTSDRTTALLPELEKERVGLMGRLSAHLDVLTDPAAQAETDADAILAELDAIPQAAARAALDTLERAVSETDRQERRDAAAREAYVAEQEALEAGNNGPGYAPWHARGHGVPLWQAVDFVDTLGEDDRAGVEAALLAAGFLTATVDGEGRLRAQSGQVLVSPRGEPPRQALSTVLRPDPDAAVPVAAISAVLSTIGFEDAAAVASVSRDGRWHNGVLRGRHTVETPRYIGAPARDVATATRRVRLDEINAELVRLDTAAVRRQVDRAEPGRRRAVLDDHLASAPGSQVLREALRHRRDAADRARAAAESVTAERERARSLRAHWTADLETHRATCTHFALPADVAELDAVAAACTAAEASCRELVRDVADVLAARTRLARAVEGVAHTARQRAETEEIAESCVHEWHATAAVVAAQTQALDVDVADLARELRDSDAERTRAEERCRRTVTHRDHLGRAVAEVLQQCASARARLERDRAELVSAAGRLAAHLRLPAIRAAVAEHLTADTAVESPVHLDDPALVRAAAQALLATLPPATGTGENRMLPALQRFDRDVSDRLEVEHTVADGAHVVSIGAGTSDAGGTGDDTTPTAVLAAVTHRVDEGRRALSQRERDVFTGFVLGGVADELRRRIGQAERLIAAMNESLAESRTTHGIGVRIAWRPTREDAEAEHVTRLLTEPVRSAEDGEELIELLRRRVESSHAADPSAGYALHLSRALDYRSWHTVEVTIVGPEPGQERRISARAKISQGETRFVSYVALFGAADGYLSGLPDTDTALRLVLLDDAFAKIDDPTIGELMGLLVRQDIDFVMTGHALWGCVPEVPALDVYEVRRLGDGSAVTTRVHWDGRARSLRAATVDPR